MQEHDRVTSKLRKQNFHEKRRPRCPHANDIYYRHGLGCHLHNVEVIGHAHWPVDIRYIVASIELWSKDVSRTKGKRCRSFWAFGDLRIVVCRGEISLAVCQHVDRIEIFQSQICGCLICWLDRKCRFCCWSIELYSTMHAKVSYLSLSFANVLEIGYAPTWRSHWVESISGSQQKGTR